MSELIGPAAPWVGIFDVFGIGLAFLAWYALRDASPRARGVAAAFGVVLLFRAALASFEEATGIVSLLLTPGSELRSPLGIADVGLMLAGVAAGVGAVVVAHRGVAEAADELAEDDEDDEDDDDEDGDEAEVRLQRAAVSLTPWLDVLALAVALGLPTYFGPSWFGPAGFPDSDVTAWAVLFHVLYAFLLGGALLVLAGRAAYRDAGPAAAAFGIIAVGRLVLPVFPDAFGNELWVAFATGLAAGLVAATAVRLVARGLPGDRHTALVGSLAALALLALLSMVSGRVLAGLQDGSSGGLLDYVTPEESPSPQ